MRLFYSVTFGVSGVAVQGDSVSEALPRLQGTARGPGVEGLRLSPLLTLRIPGLGEGGGDGRYWHNTWVSSSLLQ